MMEKNEEIRECLDRIKELEHFIWENKLQIPAQKKPLTQSLGHLNSDALIERSRDIVATHFLENKETGDVLLFVDDDIVFTGNDVRTIIKDCLDTKSVVVGIYPLRSDINECLPIHPIVPGNIQLGSAELVEMKWVSSGFMGIHRKVFEKISKNTEYFARHVPPFYNFFPTKWIPDPLEGWEMHSFHLSEDWGMCDKARDEGFKVWIDPKVILGHVGEKIYSAYEVAEKKSKKN